MDALYIVSRLAQASLRIDSILIFFIVLYMLALFLGSLMEEKRLILRMHEKLHIFFIKPGEYFNF